MNVFNVPNAAEKVNAIEKLEEQYLHIKKLCDLVELFNSQHSSVYEP